MNNLLGFGGASLTSMKSYNEVLNILHTAKNLGIAHFDTAPLYGKGYSEIIYGYFLKSDRQNLSITTKVGLGDQFKASNIPVQLLLPINYYGKRLKSMVKPPAKSIFLDNNYIPDRIIDKSIVESSFKKSLKRLQTDYIDYYMLHEATPFNLTDEAKTFLIDLKTKGYVRYLGIATNVKVLQGLNPDSIKNWDILQYEGDDRNINQFMINKFNTHRHFHHSCLKPIDTFPIENVTPQERAGFLLFQDVLQNPNGKTIFSTRSAQRLKENLSAFMQFYGAKNPSI